MRFDGPLTGYVIHHRPYRETSVIADFFTRSHGRISAVVRGVRKAKSDKKSLIQGFQPVSIQLTGKSDLKTLTRIEANANAFPIQGEALYCGLYMNELLTRVIPSGLAIEHVYDTYEACLKALLDEQAFDIVLRHFEFALLEELGVMPDFTIDASTEEPIEIDKYYRFSSERGFEISLGDRPSYSGQTIIDLASQNWNASSRKLAKHLCRKMLTPLIGEKPLNSRALFKPKR